MNCALPLANELGYFQRIKKQQQKKFMQQSW